jgi:hypothetical protein
MIMQTRWKRCFCKFQCVSEEKQSKDLQKDVDEYRFDQFKIKHLEKKEARQT